MIPTARRDASSAWINPLQMGTKMLTTGNQLKAARALAGLNQSELAKMAGLNIATISAMEGKAAGTLTSGLDTVQAVMRALSDAGVQVTNYDGRPGVEVRRAVPVSCQ
jgi:DNA-binding XRE family transcriptional regulator